MYHLGQKKRYVTTLPFPCLPLFTLLPSLSPFVLLSSLRLPYIVPLPLFPSLSPNFPTFLPYSLPPSVPTSSLRPFLPDPPFLYLCHSLPAVDSIRGFAHAAGFAAAWRKAPVFNLLRRRFFAPQRRHTAPMGVKFGMEKERGSVQKPPKCQYLPKIVVFGHRMQTQ